MLEAMGRKLAHFLSQEIQPDHSATCSPAMLYATLRKGDVLLVEGNSRFSSAIKYLTQSTWSHAALCIADGPDFSESANYDGELLEADVEEGVRIVDVERYSHVHTRICRPVGLKAAEIDTVVQNALDRLGHQYDLKNIFDLARYVITTPPIPTQWRRHMLTLGSGDPTRAICSSLIAEAYQSVNYPILPLIIRQDEDELTPSELEAYQEVLHIRHHSLFAPRDFDLSPYFEVVKPTLHSGFDPHTLTWAQPETAEQHSS